MSPLCSIPFVTTSVIRIDWLHVADQGVSANFLGSLFLMFLEKLPGRSQQEQLSELFYKIKGFYLQAKCESRLQDLTLNMLKKSGKTPKLRGRAADVRALVPFAFATAQTLLDSDNPMQATAQAMAGHLNNCYGQLSPEGFDSLALAENCRKFCLLAVSMEGKEPVNWGVKPKLHMFQELCEMSGYCPSLCWTYRDEDMGGSLAKIAHRQGGPNTAKAVPAGLLRKWCAMNPVPRIGSLEPNPGPTQDVDSRISSASSSGLGASSSSTLMP